MVKIRYREDKSPVKPKDKVTGLDGSQWLVVSFDEDYVYVREKDRKTVWRFRPHFFKMERV